MREDHIVSQTEKQETEDEGVVEALPKDREQLETEFQELNDKYLRLYAEFETYKRRVNKDKEELIRYGNESLLHELLPIIDSLELALKHASDDVSEGIVQGVEITLKELNKTLEKFGLRPIEADGRPFDPSVHHAMTQVIRDDVEDNTVVEEFRKGYMLKEKVLRPSLVAVSKKSETNHEEETEQEIKVNKIIEEES
jgi:molecular chaperone GrpE